MVCVCAIAGAFATGAGAADQTVSALSSNEFSAAEVTVTQGEHVTFMNVGGQHNVRFDGESDGTPADATTDQWSFTRTFDATGDFRFYCERHGGPGGSGMAGIVHVVAPPSNPPPENPPPGGGPPAQDPGGGGSTNPGTGGPAPGGQTPGSALKVSLKASDTTPLAGKLVRLFGVVKPARDGRKLQIQKRLRSGKFKTIATARLHAASGDKSTYSLKLRLAMDVTLRARVAGDDERATGLSKARKLDVHRAA
jgi:plastocyanin